MGVRTFMQNRFTAAQQYLAALEKYKAGLGAPLKRDLELETIGEIIQGKRLIHCHSYRSDEILSTLRLMQDFGVRIGTFQHVLEGYKVANELAAGKVGGSTFADWWAYKFEVYDGIPYNGAIMWDRNVVVSFNSDSSDLARRLNTEAAKAVKFGGVPEEEALKFVTLNPAKQLQIDNRVGSLEPGKDADFVIWSGNPLDSTSACEQTWIDGKKYFDRSLSSARAEAMEKERQALIEKAKKVLNVATASGEEGDAAGKKKFFEHSLEHMNDHREQHCDDGIAAR
jgi:imidazolonepropionase-like amidohydrolase